MPRRWSERITTTVLRILGLPTARFSCTTRGWSATSSLQQRSRKQGEHRVPARRAARYPAAGAGLVGALRRLAGRQRQRDEISPCRCARIAGRHKIPLLRTTRLGRQHPHVTKSSKPWPRCSATSISSRAAANWPCATTSLKPTTGASSRPISTKRSSAPAVTERSSASSLDLDDLKMVNNVYGHLSGSRTLQEVAKRILSAVRGIDKVVRFGRRRILRHPPPDRPGQAVAVANRIARAMSPPTSTSTPTSKSHHRQLRHRTYPPTPCPKENLIRQADAAMYA